MHRFAANNNNTNDFFFLVLFLFDFYSTLDCLKVNFDIITIPIELRS